MQIDSIEDSTRYVVSTLHHGSILPGRRMDMIRHVYLLSGADVRGGVWGGSITVSGAPIVVGDAVYCKGALRIEAADVQEAPDGEITFGSSVAAADSIVTESKHARLRFRSDIYTGQINITNAFVYGNIYAKRAIIRDSIILGGVFCGGPVRIERSMVSTLEAGDLYIGPETWLFMPLAVGRNSIQLDAPVRVVTFYSMLQDAAGQRKGDVVLLDAGDVHTLKSQERGQPSGKEGEAQAFKCLSLSDRILDTFEVKEHFDFNRRLIEKLALGRNLDPDSSSQVRHTERELEAGLLEFLHSSGTQASERASTSIKDLFERVNDKKG